MEVAHIKRPEEGNVLGTSIACKLPAAAPFTITDLPYLILFVWKWPSCLWSRDLPLLVRAVLMTGVLMTEGAIFKKQ